MLTKTGYLLFVSLLDSALNFIFKILTFFILYVKTMKWIICAQETIEVSSVSQRPKLSPIKISDLSLATKIEQQ